MEGEGEGSLFGDQWKEKVIFYLFPFSPQTTSFRPSFFILCDALPSPRVNPLEGSLKCSCGKLGLERRSQLPTLERDKGQVGSPRIRLGRRFSRSSLNLHQNKPPTWLVHIPGHL